MGEKIVVCGEAGQGQAVKVISQAITAVNCATLAQGLVLARQAGVDVDALLQTMDGGSSDSTMRALKGKPMLEHDFTPLFKLAHMLKDVQLCLAEARTAGGAFPVRRARRGALRRGRRARARRAGLRAPCSRWSRASPAPVCNDLARCALTRGNRSLPRETRQFAATF